MKWLLLLSMFWSPCEPQCEVSCVGEPVACEMSCVDVPVPCEPIYVPENTPEPECEVTPECEARITAAIGAQYDPLIPLITLPGNDHTALIAEFLGTHIAEMQRVEFNNEGHIVNLETNCNLAAVAVKYGNQFDLYLNVSSSSSMAVNKNVSHVTIYNDCVPIPSCPEPWTIVLALPICLVALGLRRSR